MSISKLPSVLSNRELVSPMLWLSMIECGVYVDDRVFTGRNGVCLVRRP